MRTTSLKIYVGSTMPNDLKSFLDANCIDYEWSSAEQGWIIYYHFDDVFPYSDDLLAFVHYIKDVYNLFPHRKGIFRDIIELYYEVSKGEINQDIDWFEWEGKFYQNVRFAELALHQNKQLYKRQVIMQGG